MTLIWMKQMMARAVAAGAVFAASVAAVPARAADDLPIVRDIQIPMPRVLEDEGTSPGPGYESAPYRGPYAQQPYRPGPYAPGSYAAIPRRYDRSELDARPMLPPGQVVHLLRASGYSLMGPVMQRDWVYTVAVLDRNGDDGRLIVDARTGRIMRFIPAMDADARLNDRSITIYGPPPAENVGYDGRRGSLLDMQHAPRPPVAVPKVTQRASPKIAVRAPSAPIPAARPVEAPLPQQAAPAQPSTPQPAKTAETAAAAATVGTAQPAAAAARPPISGAQPTTTLPAVQPLE